MLLLTLQPTLGADPVGASTRLAPIFPQEVERADIEEALRRDRLLPVAPNQLAAAFETLASHGYRAEASSGYPTPRSAAAACLPRSLRLETLLALRSGETLSVDPATVGVLLAILPTLLDTSAAHLVKRLRDALLGTLWRAQATLHSSGGRESRPAAPSSTFGDPDVSEVAGASNASTGDSGASSETASEAGADG